MAHRTITTGWVVTVSFIVGLLDIVTNLVVAVLTGRAVVSAKMAQGAADAVGSLLLVVGHRRSRRHSDPIHPMGFAREVFFWALLSSPAMLVLGAGVTLGPYLRPTTRSRAPRRSGASFSRWP